MANDLVILKEHWLELSARLKDLPGPFQQEIFLEEVDVAGTSHIEDIEAKTADLNENSILMLLRDSSNEYDDCAIAVITEKGDRIGWVPMDENSIFSRLMDAGKLLYARVVSKKMIRNAWLKMSIKIFMRDI